MDCSSLQDRRSLRSASAFGHPTGHSWQSPADVRLPERYGKSTNGKFMLAFVMVWAYFNFSQWLIIWAGNLLRRDPWYTARMMADGKRWACFWMVSTSRCRSRWLLSRQLKRKARTLVWLATWLPVHAHRRYLFA